MTCHRLTPPALEFLRHHHEIAVSTTVEMSGQCQNVGLKCGCPEDDPHNFALRVYRNSECHRWSTVTPSSREAATKWSRCAAALSTPAIDRSLAIPHHARRHLKKQVLCRHRHGLCFSAMPMKDMQSSHSRTVALFSTIYLQYSQTFIYDEIRAHQRYDIEVFARKAENLEQFPIPTLHALEGPGNGRLGDLEASLYSLLRISPRFDRLFSARDYALIHAHFGPGAVNALPFANKHHLPLVVTFHGYDVPLLKSPSRWHPRSARYALYGPQVLNKMTLGLCASNELKELLIEFGVAPEKLRVYRLGIDLEKFRFEPPAPDAIPEVVLVGRFVEKKGFEYAIRAFASQIHAGKKARLTIIGDGERRQKLTNLIKREGIEEQVEFTGILPSEKVAERLRKAHILMAPSVTAIHGDRESGVIVIKEACASGAVPIATWHGGIPEIVEDGNTGFLAHERDVAALSKALENLLSDPALLETMALNARRKMEDEYDLYRRVEHLEELYDEAVSLHQTNLSEGLA